MYLVQLVSPVPLSQALLVPTRRLLAMVQRVAALLVPTQRLLAMVQRVVALVVPVMRPLVAVVEPLKTPATVQHQMSTVPLPC
jgi:hypothetical protein